MQKIVMITDMHTVNPYLHMLSYYDTLGTLCSVAFFTTKKLTVLEDDLKSEDEHNNYDNLKN